MDVRIEPPLESWRVPEVGAVGTVGAVVGVVATGHQLSLWHPGILVKDLAAAAATGRLCGEPNAETLHLFVDHDTNQALRLTLPVVRPDDAGMDRLHAVTVSLAEENLNLPVWSRPPPHAEHVLATLDHAVAGFGGVVPADLEPLRGAIASMQGDQHVSLATWMGEFTKRLLTPYTGTLHTACSSELFDADENGLLAAMRDDAASCIRHYNAAAAAHPEAGIPPLLAAPERVELPVWRLDGEPGGGGARLRVFADLADSQPLLVDERDRPLEPPAAGDTWTAAPRAISLSAIMRRYRCDLFIHGSGGAVYDRVTDAWWRAWRGERLPPAAMATADVHLDFDVPLATAEEVERAVWFRHHLPHNIDRFVDLSPTGRAKAAAKARLLEQLDEEVSHRRRQAAFQSVHRINADLASLHAETVAESHAAVDRAVAGMHNAETARRRDWAFPLYPRQKLERLGATLKAAASVP